MALNPLIHGIPPQLPQPQLHLDRYLASIEPYAQSRSFVDPNPAPSYPSSSCEPTTLQQTSFWQPRRRDEQELLDDERHWQSGSSGWAGPQAEIKRRVRERTGSSEADSPRVDHDRPDLGKRPRQERGGRLSTHEPEARRGARGDAQAARDSGRGGHGHSGHGHNDEGYRGRDRYEYDMRDMRHPVGQGTGPHERARLDDSVHPPVSSTRRPKATARYRPESVRDRARADAEDTESAVRRLERKLRRRDVAAVARPRAPSPTPEPDDHELEDDFAAKRPLRYGKKAAEAARNRAMVDGYQAKSVQATHITEPLRAGMMARAVTHKPARDGPPVAQIDKERRFLRLDSDSPDDLSDGDRRSLARPPLLQATVQTGRHFVKSGKTSMSEIAAQSRHAADRRRYCDETLLDEDEGRGMDERRRGHARDGVQDERPRSHARLPSPGMTGSPPWQTIASSASVHPPPSLVQPPREQLDATAFWSRQGLPRTKLGSPLPLHHSPPAASPTPVAPPTHQVMAPEQPAAPSVLGPPTPRATLRPLVSVAPLPDSTAAVNAENSTVCTEVFPADHRLVPADVRNPSARSPPPLVPPPPPPAASDHLTRCRQPVLGEIVPSPGRPRAALGTMAPRITIRGGPGTAVPPPKLFALPAGPRIQIPPPRPPPGASGMRHNVMQVPSDQLGATMQPRPLPNVAPTTPPRPPDLDDPGARPYHPTHEAQSITLSTTNQVHPRPHSPPPALSFHDDTRTRLPLDHSSSLYSPLLHTPRLQPVPFGAPLDVAAAQLPSTSSLLDSSSRPPDSPRQDERLTPAPRGAAQAFNATPAQYAELWKRPH